MITHFVLRGKHYSKFRRFMRAAPLFLPNPYEQRPSDAPDAGRMYAQAKTAYIKGAALRNESGSVWRYDSDSFFTVSEVDAA